MTTTITNKQSTTTEFLKILDKDLQKHITNELNNLEARLYYKTIDTLTIYEEEAKLELHTLIEDEINGLFQKRLEGLLEHYIEQRANHATWEKLKQAKERTEAIKEIEALEYHNSNITNNF